MADFRTHMTVSTSTGVVFALIGYQNLVPWQTCVLGGGLCSVAGMLPDLDSDSGRPLREATTLASAVVPMLMVDRFQRFNWGHETMVLASAVVYFTIRFLITELFRRYTVHRGMWHSLPAAAIVGMFAFLVMSTDDISIRLFKTSAVVLGFMSHLILDEIWSVDFRRGRYQFKKSFGTALKFWGSNPWANYFIYGKLVVLGLLVYQDHGFMQRFSTPTPDVPHTARELFNILLQRGGQWLH